MIVQCLRALLDVSEPDYAWIVQADGKLIDATLRAKKIDIQSSFRFWLKHNTRKRLTDSRSEKLTFKSAAGLEEGLSGVFSASEVQFFSQSFYLIKPLSADSKSESGSALVSGTASEALSFWKWLPSEGVFEVTGLLKVRLENEGFLFTTYDDFLNLLSAESLQRFVPLMESALNFGKSFELEVFLYHPRQGKWIRMDGHSTYKEGTHVLSGSMVDLSAEREAQKTKTQLDLWLNSGLSLFEVKDAEGQVIATWGSSSQSPQVQLEPHKRVTRLMDFRNRPKFTITAELGVASLHKSADEVQPPIAPKQDTAALDSEAKENKLPKTLSSLTSEERCVAVTQWLGQSLDAQVSALGVFDGSRFEWKAWWKSPNRYAMPVKKYTGEWLPELDWLLDVEQKDPKDLNSIWWPQDLLPFKIGKNHGDGWILLTEPLGNNMTSLLAIQTVDPESVKEKTRHVLQGLELLKADQPGSAGVTSENSSQVLEEEIRRRDLLLKEVNHRAKNNLSLAASLVKMEAGFSSNEEAISILKQTQHRLETLAGLHELMYKQPQSQEKIDASLYLNALLEGLVKGFGRKGLKTEFHVESVWLPVKTANTLGLLVNELVSNAFKHAFSDEKADLLKVDFLKKGNVFKLRVSDNGPGISMQGKDSDSLGHILIDEFVKQLDGEIEINSGNGTTYLISFPKSSD